MLIARLSVALCGAAALIAALPAAATISVFAPAGAPDPGSPAEMLVVDFDNPNAPGFVWDGAPATHLGTQRGLVLAPAGVTDRFGYVLGKLGVTDTATLRTPSLQSISFYWGWMNPSNRVDVLDSAGSSIFSVTAGQLPRVAPWNAAQANRRVFFTATSGTSIGGLRFFSPGVGFEFDNIMAATAEDISSAGVPEPAAWAMLIAGFGLVGASSRRRGRVVTA
jgi:hypothetical protein